MTSVHYTANIILANLFVWSVSLSLT